MGNVHTRFDEKYKTLYIYGSGDITWRDTCPYSNDTEHIIIDGFNIKCTDGFYLFAEFFSLKDIQGLLDTSKCKNFGSFYYGCKNLYWPLVLDTSCGINFESFHYNNEVLSVARFNNTCNGKKFSDMFKKCPNMTNVIGLTIKTSISIEDISDNLIVQFQLSRYLV